jgi:DNA-binding SARP family transcriptional activator/tetratricopeptide (TPR) repeat protein
MFLLRHWEQYSVLQAGNMGFEICFFGEFAIQNAGVEINGLGARHQSLIAYLALRTPSPVQRSEIAFHLWMDSREAQALTNLRKALHQIRNILQNGDLIRADSHSLRLNLSNDDRIDVLEFRAQFDIAEQARANNDMDVEQAALEVISSLYKGDLLQNMYDEWLLPERARLHHLFVQSTERLIALLEARRHYRDAIKQALRLLQTDNLHEATYRTLIRLHALNDDRAAALSTYHACAGLLSRELGVDPDASTRELYEQLLKSDTRLFREKAMVVPVSHPLVGRDGEWKTLLGGWKAAGDGGLRMILISGESGIGKTRLAEELLHWADRQGIQTASATCYSAEGQVSFASVASWLKSIPLRELDAHWRNELSRILPELRSETDPLPLMTESWKKRIFFEAMARAVLSSQEPLLLLLDDLQWCDKDSLEWLGYFLRFGRKTKALILATLRAEELILNFDLQSLLVDLRAEGRLTELDLQRLDESQTALLGSHLLRKDLPDEDARNLFRESEGVPLFVVELANAGMKPGPTAHAETGMEGKKAGEPTMALPPRLRAILERRLTRLSSPARSAVETAAVIGREFDFDLLMKISEQEEGIAVNALDELWQARMIREREGRYDFSHDKLREVALAGISPIRLRWLHQRAGEALEANEETAEYARIAGHFERAGLRAKASGFYASAAGQSCELFAFTEALDHLKNALLLETRHNILADLHEQRGDVLMMLDRREDAFQAFSQAHGLSNNHLQKARLNRKQSSLTVRFNIDVARQKYQSGLDELARIQTGDAYWSEWIEAQLTWFEVCYWMQNAGEASRAIEQLRLPVEQHGSLAQKIKYRQASIANAMVNERYRLNRSHLDLAQESLVLAIETGDSHHISNAKRQLGMVALHADQLDIAEAAFREAISLCKMNGDLNSMLIGWVYLSATHRRQHKPREVRTDTVAFQELLLTISDNPVYRGVAHANYAWLAYDEGKFEQAQQSAQAALELWRSLENPYAMHWMALIILLAINVRQEKLGEAIACIKTMLTPPQMKLTLEVETALLSILEVDPSNPSLIFNLCREAVEKAMEAGYL